MLRGPIYGSVLGRLHIRRDPRLLFYGTLISRESPDGTPPRKTCKILETRPRTEGMTKRNPGQNLLSQKDLYIGS